MAHGGTGYRAEQTACEHPGHAEPARKPADQGIGHLDELFDNGTGRHDIAAEDEKQHHYQGKIIHAPQQRLGQQEQGQVGKQEESENSRKKKTHKNRDVGGHATQEDE